MIPPTPTFFPTPNPADMIVQLPNTRIWEFTDEAIQTWNRFDDSSTNMLQWIVVIMIVIVAMFYFATLVRSLSKRDDAQ
ncbi:MAG: hypothetical protein KJ065_26930 [Anaerolineae bacterium]|nr:hypothetical protein [Anaerolineae bacterium]MCL4251817.1 hypothetical protein [Anaerolineae bacterium]